MTATLKAKSSFMYRRFALSCALALLVTSTHAAPQDPATLAALAERFLARETAGLGGEVSYQVDAPRAILPACPAPEIFMPAGSRLLGRTTLGARCASPVRWTLYLRARVRLVADYLTLARSRPSGHVLGPADLVVRRGDLGELPQDALTDAAAAQGKELVSGLAAGAPLRSTLLRPPLVAKSGQTLPLTLDGPGFSIRNEGVALANARVGDTLRIRSAGGRIVSGTVHADGSVHIDY